MFRRPKNVPEAAANIRELKASRQLHQQRGDHDGVRAVDAEIQHQQAEKKRLAAESNRRIDEIWGR